MRERMDTAMAIADQEDWQTWSEDLAEFMDDGLPELSNMTRGEIRSYVARAHEDGDVGSRYTAASILWALDNEKHLISNPALITRAAGRLMMNAMYDDTSSFYDGLRENTPGFDEEKASEVIGSVAWQGNTGYWPNGVTREELGAAVALLAGVDWTAEILNPSQLLSERGPKTWWTTKSSI